MKFLRHILSHIFLISFLVAVVSVFYYRTLLLPNDVVSKVDGVVKEIYPPALGFVSKRDYFWSIKGERIVSFDDLTIFEKNDEIASKSKADDVTEVEAQVETKTESVLEVAKEIEPKKTDVVKAEDKNQKEATVVIAKVDESVVAKEAIIEPVKENNVSGNNKIEELPIVVKDRDTSSERDLLISARNAFNKGRVSQSEKFYLELTRLDQDSPDAFGELGNVYYSQGKWDEAGQAYYEAAVRLISAGSYSQVVYLQRVIKGLNIEHAEKLAQLMMRQ